MALRDDVQAALVADLAAIKGSASSTPSSLQNAKDRLKAISGRAQIALDRIAAGSTAWPDPCPEPVPCPEPEPVPDPTPVPDPPPPPPPVPPAPNGLLEIEGTLTSDALAARILAAPAGPVYVRPPAGKTLTVSTGHAAPRAGVTYDGVTFNDGIEFRPGINGCTVRSSQVLGGFNVFGAADITFESCTIDGQGREPRCHLWDRPAGQPARNVRILRCTLRNFYTTVSGDHTEALYVGFVDGLLVEGCTFVDNGTTGHIFFTWFGEKADPATSYPRGACVRACTFGARKGAYVDVNFRDELDPAKATICVDPAQGAVLSRPVFARACPAA